MSAEGRPPAAIRQGLPFPPLPPAVRPYRANGRCVLWPRHRDVGT